MFLYIVVSFVTTCSGIGTTGAPGADVYIRWVEHSLTVKLNSAKFHSLCSNPSNVVGSIIYGNFRVSFWLHSNQSI